MVPIKTGDSAKHGQRRGCTRVQKLTEKQKKKRRSVDGHQHFCRAGIYRAIAAAVRSMNFVSMIPPLEVFCREVDECPKRPLIIFEENYCRFGRACELCGTRQEGTLSTASFRLTRRFLFNYLRNNRLSVISPVCRSPTNPHCPLMHLSSTWKEDRSRY